MINAVHILRQMHLGFLAVATTEFNQTAHISRTSQCSMVWFFLEYLILLRLENNDKCQNHYQLSLRPAMHNVSIVSEADLTISSVFIQRKYTSLENYLNLTLF